MSGACCVTALIQNQEMIVSNLGDCRAVLCRGGVAEALTTDHRAGRDDERKRIENQVSFVKKFALRESRFDVFFCFYREVMWSSIEGRGEFMEY